MGSRSSSNSPATARKSGITVPDRSRGGITSRPWWPGLKRVLTCAFFALVAWLIVKHARQIEWSDVFVAMQRYTTPTLLAAAALALASHAVYGSYDVLGRHYAGHDLRIRQVIGVTFVSYAFNLNFGSLVGGFAFRYRLYSRLGLDTAVITRVLALSLTTNWLGYLALGGTLFLLRPLELPPDWKLGSGGLRWLGASMLATSLAYLALCAFARRRSFNLRGHDFTLPGARLALLQLALSMLNWALIGGVVFMLLQRQIDYPTVLAVLLVAAVAGVIAHVPAGLGVLEAVFVALLSHRVPTTELLAALLTYRAIYYLAPLAVAVPLYLTMEARARRAGCAGGQAVGPRAQSS